MRLLEHESKDLLRRFGVACPQGRPCASVDEVRQAAEEYGAVAVKALVAAGRRGKGGGVAIAHSSEEAAATAGRMLGTELYGRRIERVLVEQALEIDAEIFLAWTYDTDARAPVLLASADGGVDIEDAAAAEGVLRRAFDPRRSVEPYECRGVADDLGLTGASVVGFGDVAARLWRLFVQEDALNVEVNPLAMTASGLVAVGAVVELDDAADGRHPDRPPSSDSRELTELERIVVAADLADSATSGVRFQELDGDIVNLVIGGGSGLTYMDYLQRRHGLQPANIIDVSPGRGLTKLRIAIGAALCLPRRRAVMFTIPHSNLARVNVVFEQFHRAFEEVRETWEPIPIVVRMSGAGEEEAREMAASIPNCTFFGDEVTIEEAIDHMVELLARAETPA